MGINFNKETNLIMKKYEDPIELYNKIFKKQESLQ